MRVATTLVGVLLLLAACAPARYEKASQAEIYCRTHARQATYTGSPDEQRIYLECLRTPGVHEVEVKPAE